MIDQEPDGATPVSDEEAVDLIPGHISTRSDLNAWEQANMLDAAEWAERTRKDALDSAFLRELHQRMFDRTWRWAGQYRRTNKNIGVDWIQIQQAVHDLGPVNRPWHHLNFRRQHQDDEP